MEEMVEGEMMEEILRVTVCGLCAYETIAIMSNGRIPTITSVVGNYPAVGVGIIFGLAYHFRRSMRYAS